MWHGGRNGPGVAEGPAGNADGPPTRRGVAVTRLLTETAVSWEGAAVTVVGRRVWAPLANFVQALRRYRWPEAVGA